ncbi:MAG: hypothetical protein RL122_2596 [Pseudomonadota bacterium]
MLTLIPHPTTPCPVVESLHVAMTRVNAGWHLCYTLRGDLQQLRIPAPQIPAAVDGLWEHTCFEAFIGVLNSAAYHEFNFSPSHQWAAYAFSDYRQRVDWQTSHAPRMVTTGTTGQLLVDIHLAVADFPANPAHQPLQLGLTAVLETAAGEKTYWALAHPTKRPDFHHRDGFTHAIWS